MTLYPDYEYVNMQKFPAFYFLTENILVFKLQRAAGGKRPHCEHAKQDRQHHIRIRRRNRADGRARVPGRRLQRRADRIGR